MKKYIFITSCVASSVAGGVLFLKNKTIYLKSLGWETHIFSFAIGKIRVPELRDYKKEIIEELQFPPYFFTNGKRDSIIKKMMELADIHPNDEVVVESSHTFNCLWGELLAQKVGGEHYIYAIDERHVVRSSKDRDYLKYKLNRNELASIIDSSIKIMFGNDDVDSSKYQLSACPTSSITNVDDVPFSNSKIKKGYVNVLSLGRLNKSYHIPTLKSFAEYASNRNKLNFNLIVVSDYNQEEKKQAENIFSSIDNVNLIMTGGLFPLPLKLFKLSDVCIASSGCVGLANAFGVPTISIDGYDLLPIGIFGYNTENFLCRSKDEIPVPLTNLLDFILLEKKCEKKITIPEMYHKMVDYSSHMKFFQVGKNDHKYYDIDKFNTIHNNLVKIFSLFFDLPTMKRLAKKVISLKFLKCLSI